MRLAKYLASCGLGSRRACERMIERGSVAVNGVKVKKPATDIDPAKDKITADGRSIEVRERVYYIVNKPKGYTSSRSDKHADKLVTELVPDDPPVWPVGRLDRETTGLLILTNDGDLTQRLTHPSYQKEKEYLLSTDTRFTDDELSEARAGVPLVDGMFIPDLIEPAGGKSYRIVIHEGRNRLLRRFAAYFGKKTTALHRERMAAIRLGDLKPGEYRVVTKGELDSIDSSGKA